MWIAVGETYGIRMKDNSEPEWVQYQPSKSPND